MISKEYLINKKNELVGEANKASQEIANLKNRLKVMEDTALQINGAIIICDQLLGEVDKPAEVVEDVK